VAKKGPINFRFFDYCLNLGDPFTLRVRTVDAILPRLLILSALWVGEKAEDSQFDVSINPICSCNLGQLALVF
jgi:hypothetical protein